MAYQFIVLDSILNFEKDGEYAGFIDVNGKAYKEKAIRDDNIAGEVLTSLLELVGAIVLSVFTGGAAAGAYVGRVASFVKKAIDFGVKVKNTIINFAGKIGSKIGQAVSYGAKTITNGYIKAAADVSKAAIFGIPARLAKGDKPADILKGYGVAVLGAGSLRSFGKAGYDTFLFKQALKFNNKLKFDNFLKNRSIYLKDFGIKKNLEKGIQKYIFDKNRLRKLNNYLGQRRVRLSSINDIDYKNIEFQYKADIEYNILNRFEFSFNSTISDDLAKAVLKGAEAQSLLKITNKLTGVLKKYLIARVLQLENTKLAKRLLLTYINLVKRKKDLLKKIDKGIKNLKNRFYQFFNFERVKQIFDKRDLKLFKYIRESSYDYSSQAEKKTKEEIANDFLAKNQKLLLFDDSNKQEGGFGSQWLLGYKWITRYDKNTNEILDTGSLRIYFKARIPKERYKEKYVKLRKKEDSEATVFELRRVERKLFKAAITFRNVPFQRFEEMVSSSSPGQYYWNVFAKQPKNKVSGAGGWKPRTYADIDFLMGQQNLAGIYGLQVKGLSDNVLKQAMGYSSTGQNILKFQGKSKEIISFIKNPLKNTTKTVSQNFQKLNVLKRTNR